MLTAVYLIERLEKQITKLISLLLYSNLTLLKFVLRILRYDASCLYRIRQASIQSNKTEIHSNYKNPATAAPIRLD